MERQGSVTIEGVTVTFSKPVLLDDTDNTVNKSVIVSGFKTVPSENILRLFFTNERKCGGGAVNELVIDQSKKQAVVTFEDEAGLSSGLQYICAKLKNCVQSSRIKKLHSCTSI